ncbi:hypothetical protein GYMLUDRAFT_244609 [Collybiopsis luxurians FD-317 M1]|uniref:Uncharacterized protein n=1 Tax=Collybiopsis luxurians FD-317 M1 TaxID=944289 RepID=A0A0D0CCD7_9AGAR|nr:hypothetical protein GYMLUDRAFT_244609 [Collybiopsis luxurians FD-317 M1]
MKGPHDPIIRRLLEANLVDEIPGRFQFRLQDIETVIAYRKGIALGSVPTTNLSFGEFRFPERAEDFEPGTYLNLRPRWSWTMDDDLANVHKILVPFSSLPDPTNLRRRTAQVLQDKALSFCFPQTNAVCWVYWFFEPPFTFKIGKTVNLSRRMMEWHCKCPNPLRVWCSAYVASCGYSFETLSHWKMEQSTYDRPLQLCWSCGIPHREVFITVKGFEETDQLILSIMQDIERVRLR